MTDGMNSNYKSTTALQSDQKKKKRINKKKNQ